MVLLEAQACGVPVVTSARGGATEGIIDHVTGFAFPEKDAESLESSLLRLLRDDALVTRMSDAARQHVTLAGNGALIPAFVDSAAATSPVAPPADPLATLNDIYSQRDDRWLVQANLAQPTLKIGSNLALSIRSQRDGFVYLFYQGTQPGSFYLLFPNQLDSKNAIGANQDLKLPRQDWNVTALGPRGTDHLLVMVTATPRDFSSLSLPAEYVSAAGPFEQIHPTVQAVAHIAQIAAVSAAAGRTECQATAGRDLGVARQCSNAFGAGLVSVEETD